MYRKKELLIAGLVGVIILVYFFIINYQKEESILEEPNYDYPNPIVITIDGEVVRRTELVYNNPITYGALFIRIKNICNEYSDLTGFDLFEVISNDIEILIPTIDFGNNYDGKIANKLININEASQIELMTLSQIGEKRSQKIIDYRTTYGKINSWDLLWQITSVPDAAKEQIIQQAVL